MTQHPWKITIYERGDPMGSTALLFRLDATNMDDAIRKARAQLPQGFVEGSVWAQRGD